MNWSVVVDEANNNLFKTAVSHRVNTTARYMKLVVLGAKSTWPNWASSKQLAIYGTLSTLPLSAEKPDKAYLTSNQGWDDGLLDGSYDITMNLWWGSNGNTYMLYENGVLIDSQPLVASTPGAQTAQTTFAGKPNGTYRYTAKLINSRGETWSDELIVEVSQAGPGTPDLAAVPLPNETGYTFMMNLWWGSNGTEYRLYENGELIDTQTLITATPHAQSATTTVTDREPGVYTYQAELINDAGEARSAAHIVIWP